jgi:hypothetical protein
MNSTSIGWFTTLPNPYKPAHTHGADAGQVGWRLHAVPVSEDGEPLKRGNALCGLSPRHGWGMDLFIDEECSRCADKLAAREASGEAFTDVPKARAAARQAAWQEGDQAAYRGHLIGSNPYPVASWLHAHWLRGFNEE